MQPVIIEDVISIAANSVNENVIVSNPSLRGMVRAPFQARGKLIGVQSATGLALDLNYGSKNVVASSNLRVSSGSPDDPLDVVNENWYPAEGDQLTLRAANTTGGAITLRYRLALFPWEGEVPPDMRVQQQGPTSIAAGAVDTQLLDGMRYERAPVDSLLRVLMTASATGMLRQLFVDMDRIAPATAVNLNNRIPNDPFDQTVEGVEVAKDSLVQLSVSNPTAGALNVFWKICLQEMVRT